MKTNYKKSIFWRSFFNIGLLPVISLNLISFSVFSQGETCTNPIVLNTLSGSISANTVGRINDYSGSCTSGATGPDLVYKLQDSVPNGWIVNVKTTNDNYDVLLYGRYGSCTGSQMFCADNDGERLQWKNNTGSKQAVWFFIDGFNSPASGQCNLVWNVVAPDTGDICNNAYILSANSGTISVSTSPDNVYPDYSGTCTSGATGSDKVYKLQNLVPNGWIVNFKITGDNYDALLYGRYGSCTGTQIACTDDDGARLQWKNNTGTDQPVWFFVDGFNSPAIGQCNLVWNVVAPESGNLCSTAISLSGYSGTKSVNTGSDGLWNDYYGSCASSSGSDKIYKLTTLVPNGWILNFKTTSDNYDVMLYARYGSCTGTQLACTDNDGERLRWKNTTGSSQTVWIFVDGYGGSNGSCNLNWNIIQPETGDFCSNAKTISGYSGSTSVNTASDALWNDYSGTCASSVGSDKVYKLTTTVPNGWILNFKTTIDNYDVMLYARYGSCTGTQLACTDNDGERLRWKNTTGSSQTVWIFVDGYGGSNGTCTLNWNIAQPEIGDLCSNALSLSGSSGNVLVNSTSDGVWNDYQGTCASSNGSDRVYKLTNTIPAGGTLSFKTLNDNYDVMLYARYGSCTGTQIVCTDNDGSLLSWVNNTGVPQSVWIFVDGFGGSNGTCTLNWTITTPSPARIEESEEELTENTDRLATRQMPGSLWNIYPNPADNVLHFISHEPQETDLNTQIFIQSIEGKTVYHGKWANVIDVSNLTPGIYFVNVIDDQKNVHTQKLIIQ